MNIDLIFQIGGIGILVAILHIVLKQAGKQEQAELVTLAGVVVVLWMVIQLISELFELVRSTFQLY
ncbi:MAG: stage III sporulation protein AC [Thermaerobacterales bacterium]